MNRSFSHLQQWWHARNRKPILPLWPTWTQLLDSLKPFTEVRKDHSAAISIWHTFHSYQIPPLHGFWHTWLYPPLLEPAFAFTTPHFPIQLINDRSCGSYLTLLISTFPLPPFYLHLLTSISYIMSVASLWGPLPTLFSNQFILPTATRVIF